MALPHHTFRLKEADMKAHVGDWLVVHSPTENRHERKAEILRTGPDGAPPYSVRWIDDDHESLVFPGPDAQVLSAAEQAARDRSAAALIDQLQASIGAGESTP
jgi:hypothetical protein